MGFMPISRCRSIAPPRWYHLQDEISRGVVGRLVIRKEVRQTQVSRGEHLLVYVSKGEHEYTPAIERLGIGMQARREQVTAELIRRFLAREQEFASRARQESRNGEREAVEAIERFTDELVRAK